MGKKVFLFLMSVLLLFGAFGCSSVSLEPITFTSRPDESSVENIGSLDEQLIRFKFIEQYLQTDFVFENQYVALGIDLAIVKSNLTATAAYFKKQGYDISGLVEKFYYLNQNKAVLHVERLPDGTYSSGPQEFWNYFRIGGLGFDQWRYDYPDIDLKHTVSRIAYDRETGLALIYHGVRVGNTLTDSRIYLMKCEIHYLDSHNSTLTEIASQDCEQYIVTPQPIPTTVVSSAPPDTFNPVPPATVKDIENEIFLKMVAYYHHVPDSEVFPGNRENIRVGLVSERSNRELFKQYYRGLGYQIDETVDRLFGLNQDHKIVAVDGAPTGGYQFVPDNDLDRYFREDGGGYSRWQEDHPGVVYHLQMSVPAYDPKTHLAIVYISIYNGPTYGGGFIWLMKYENGVLVKIDIHTLWIS